MAASLVIFVAVEDLPLCALADDRLVEVQGEPGNVHKAVELIVSHLRKFLVDRSVLPLFETNRTIGNQSQMEENLPHQSWGINQSSSVPSTGGSGLGNSSQYMPSALQHDNYYPPSELPQLDTQSHHGLSVYGRDPSLGGHPVSNPPPAPVITQVTQHMQIPLSYADAIIGTAGANISYMRRASGATIAIQETRGVPGEMTVEIHGTATQVQTAQQLIQVESTSDNTPKISVQGNNLTMLTDARNSQYIFCSKGTAGYFTELGTSYTNTCIPVWYQSPLLVPTTLGMHTLQHSNPLWALVIVSVPFGMLQGTYCLIKMQNFMAGVSGPPTNTYNSVDSGYSSYPTQNSMYSSPPPNTGHGGHSTGVRILRRQLEGAIKVMTARDLMSKLVQLFHPGGVNISNNIFDFKMKMLYHCDSPENCLPNSNTGFKVNDIAFFSTAKVFVYVPDG
eukprot:Gb_12787 [translate_table: standard]